MTPGSDCAPTLRRRTRQQSNFSFTGPPTRARLCSIRARSIEKCSLCPADQAHEGQDRNAHLCSEAGQAIVKELVLLGRFSHEELAMLCASGPQGTNDAVCVHCSWTSHGNEWLGSTWQAAHPPGLHRPTTRGASGPHSRGLVCWQARHQ